MDFEKAIVRKPTKKIKDAISSEGISPDFEMALKQHRDYVRCLEKADLEVFEMEGEKRYPDSVFVEDTAVLMDELAVVCNLGVSSREGEESSMIRYLERFYEDIERIDPPGTLEGGDVMRVEDRFYIGRSKRTNKEGIEQFSDIVGKFDHGVTSIKLDEMLHLKTGVAYIGDDCLVTAGEMKGKPEFKGFDIIEIPDKEMYAANCICVNENVIIPEGYPKTKSLIEERGFDILTVDVSEFRKLDGGISCLSLRF